MRGITRTGVSQTGQRGTVLCQGGAVEPPAIGKRGRQALQEVGCGREIVPVTHELYVGLEGRAVPGVLIVPSMRRSVCAGG